MRQDRGQGTGAHLESKRTALAHRGVEHHLSPVQLDDLLGEHQAQAAALPLLQRLRVDLREGLEQFALVVLGDAHALVAHHDRDPATWRAGGRSRGDRTLSAVFAALRSIRAKRHIVQLIHRPHAVARREDPLETLLGTPFHAAH